SADRAPVRPLCTQTQPRSSAWRLGRRTDHDRWTGRRTGKVREPGSCAGLLRHSGVRTHLAHNVRDADRCTVSLMSPCRIDIELKPRLYLPQQCLTTCGPTPLQLRELRMFETTHTLSPR